MLIGVPRETRGGRKARRHRARGRREAHQARLQGHRAVRRRRRGELQRRRLSRPPAPRSWSTLRVWAGADIVFKVRAPERARSRAACARAQTLVSFIWPAQNPELHAGARGEEGDRARDGQRAAHLARAEARRALVDGQHRRLPRGDRGGAPLRPLLHRADHRRGQGAAGEGVRDRRRRRGPRGDRHRLGPRRHRARERHAARGRRPGQVAGRRVRAASTTWRKAPASAATPR